MATKKKAAPKKKPVVEKPAPAVKEKAAPRPRLPHSEPFIAWGHVGIPTHGVRVHQCPRHAKYIGRNPLAIALVWRDNAPADIFEAMAKGFGIGNDLCPHLAVDAEGNVAQLLEVGEHGAYFETGDQARTIVIGRLGDNAKPTVKQKMIADMLVKSLRDELRVPQVINRWPEV